VIIVKKYPRIASYSRKFWFWLEVWSVTWFSSV